MAIHPNILARKNPTVKEPGRLQSLGLQRVGHNWSDWVMSMRGTVRVEQKPNHKRPFELRNLGFIPMWGHWRFWAEAWHNRANPLPWLEKQVVMQDVGQSHTHNTVVTDTESWLTSEGREQSQGQESCPRREGTGSTRKSQARGEQTDTCRLMYTFHTYTHTHEGNTRPKA